jgi:hypothetical protein
MVGNKYRLIGATQFCLIQMVVRMASDEVLDWLYLADSKIIS